MLVTGCANRQVIATTLPEWEQRFQITTEEVPAQVILSPNKQLVVVGWKNSARLYDARTGEPATKMLRHDDVGGAFGLFGAFTPDGRLLVTGGSQDLSVRVWDTQTGEQAVPPIKLDTDLLALRVSPDGKWVATASYQSALLWSLRTGYEVALPIRASGVNDLTFSRDGQKLALATRGGTPILWHLPPNLPDMPNEFLIFAGRIAGQRLAQHGILESTPFAELQSPDRMGFDPALNEWIRDWCLRLQ